MSFDGIKKYIEGDKSWFADLQTTVNRMLKGKLANVYTTNLNMAPASVSTVVKLSYGDIGVDTHVTLQPTNAAAASAMASGTLYVSAQDPTASTITITHANNISDTRSFKFTLTG